MRARRWVGSLGLTVMAGGAVWALFLAGVRWPGAAPTGPGGAPAPTSEPVAARRIKAQLFYVAEDGLRLVRVEREVPYGESLVDQARRLVEAQLEPPPPPLASAVPPGTQLKDVFVDEGRQVYLDLSGEATAGHTGGSLDEILAVYALVNAVAVNLPAVQAVQLLVDGREVDTLAGHVDLRHPLRKNLLWVAPSAEGTAATASNSPGG
jgi:hypothetical protein